MDRKILARMVWNPERNAWDIVEYKGEFQQLNPETLASLYKEARNRMENLRENLIEEALEKSSMKQAKEVIDAIKAKK